jgi:predicted enzyme related to lactoylglutathione lyase
MSEATPIPAVGRLGWIQVDCEDPERLAAFWGAVLGVGIHRRLGEGPQFIYLEPAGPGAPHVCFQRVPEAKAVKNRVHPDLWVEDVDVATARIEALGGRRRDAVDFHDPENDEHWRRMADPEGNEFCLAFGA